ncbi:MAG: hypothetical protein LBR12_03110 [Opitutaceae bacterium]|nr:hypothetical protein [Opitutaceae bacterium]
MGTHTFTIGGGRVLSNAYNQHRQLGGNLVLNGSFTYGDTAFSGCISFVSTNDTLLQTTPVITTLRNSTFLADALGRFTYADGTTDTHTANGSQLVLTGSLKDNGLGFGLTKEGDGRLVLQGLLSDYSGDVTLNTGFLEVRGDAQSLGSGSLVLNGGLLRLAPQGATGTFSYANSGVALNADATLVLDRYSLTVAVTHRFGDLAVNAPATFSVLHGYNVAANADATLQFGNITLSGATTFDVGEGAVLVLGKVSGNSVPITKTGAGTLRFDATSGVSASNGTYGDIILEDGWLQFRFTPAETAPASVGGNLILRGGKLSSNDTPSRTFYRPLAIEGDVTLGDTVANGTLVFNGSITLSGVRSLNILSKVCFNGTVTGGGLEKSGAGELAINGVNGDFGPVALREGRLSNTGKIGGAVFLGDTGALEASVGLKAGAVSFGSTLNITLDLAGAVQGGTAITLDSLAAAGSSVSLTLLNANDALLDGYTLLSIGSTLLSASDFHISGTSLDWEFAGGALQLSAPIPEPATTALLLALAALALFWVHTKGTKSPNF